jgi:protein ImuB
VLTRPVAGSLRLAAVDPAARAAGLVPGMTLADARARVLRLAVAPIDDVADAALLRRLARAAERFTPLVGLDPPDGLILDVTGCAHLFGGEAALAQTARAAMHRAGVSTRACLAATPAAARALVRFSRLGRVAAAEQAAAVAELPVAALEMEPEVTQALLRAGLRDIGDLANRAPALLAARFGAEIAEKLDALQGLQDNRITPLRRPPDCLAERHFAEPVGDMACIEAALQRLAGDVGTALARRGMGGRRFLVTLFRADGAVRRLTVETGEPCRDAAVILRLIRLKLDSLADPVDPGFGFDALRLSAGRLEPVTALAPRLDAPPVADDSLSALIDRLGARFGREQVLRLCGYDSRDPDRADDSVPAQEAAEPPLTPAAPSGEPPLRPLTLFDPPHPIDALAEVPDGPPLRFRWRRVVHEVARAEGPERIAAEWWRAGPAAPTRDYYRVEDAAGRRFWLFRQGLYGSDPGLPRWFMHGLFA